MLQRSPWNGGKRAIQTALSKPSYHATADYLCRWPSDLSALRGLHVAFIDRPTDDQIENCAPSSVRAVSMSGSSRSNSVAPIGVCRHKRENPGTVALNVTC